MVNRISKNLSLACILSLTAVCAAHAQGHKWFVKHIKPGDKCHGAVATTFYSDGRHNADGSRFRPMGLSVATWDYPFGTPLEFTNSQNGETVQVTVKDRGPARWIYHLGIHFDLSYGAAKAIHLGQNGRFESGWTCVRRVN
jgi:rare lipoprotein A (peptidoglycan hydrolase)